MKNKKILVLSTVALLSCGVIASIVVSSNSFLTVPASSAQVGSCEYYFDSNNGYTSLYEANSDRLDGSDKTIKTWGTVTDTFYNSSGTVAQQMIQSTDANGHSAATCLYTVASAQVFPVGSMVTVSGKMTLYNGMSEMTNLTVTKDKDENPSPVVPFEIDKSVFTYSKTSPEFKEMRKHGTQQVVLNNLSLGAISSSRQCYGTFPNSGTQVLLFFNSIQEQTDIVNKINTIRNNGNKANIIGYLTCFDNKNAGTNPSLQVLIRHADDITEVVNKVLDSVTVTTNKTFYYGQDINLEDFTVTAHYTNAADEVVTDNLAFVESANTSSTGSKSVTISYTHNEITKSNSCSFTVYDAVDGLYVYDPIMTYATGESFVKPTVYGSKYEETVDVKNACSFSTFYGNTSGEHLMTATYLSENGKELTDSYYYTVTSVSDWLYNGETTFSVGDDFENPVIQVKFASDTSTWVSVNGRCSINSSNVNMDAVGHYPVYVTLGNYQRTFYVDVQEVVKVVSYIATYNEKVEYYKGDAFVKPTVIAYYTDSTSSDVTSGCTFTGYDLNTPGDQEVTVTYKTADSSYSIHVYPPSTLQTETMSISGIGSYNTGNYGKSGSYGYYRAVNSSDNIAKLLGAAQVYEPTLPGAVYNISAFKDIKYLYLKYYTESGATSEAPYVSYGEKGYSDYTSNLSTSSSLKSVYVDFTAHETNYFRICSGGYNLTINSVTIYYSGNNTSHGSTLLKKGANDNEYRIAPIVYEGNLVDGESYVDVPIAINTTLGKVTATKRYTYYSYQYVNGNTSIKISDVALVDPVDVANYFQAFGCAPCNYGRIGDTDITLRDGKALPTSSQVNYLFGSEYSRCISKYSRTDGYAASVPYNGMVPTYYELDIKTGSKYSVTSRQSGRIVCFVTGLSYSAYGSGNQFVSFYTDDHYATFKEYNNFGGFMPRFTAQNSTLDYIWSEPITISCTY